MPMNDPAHPGRIEWSSIVEFDLSVTETSAILNVARPTLSSLLNGRSGVSPEMAIRLSKVLGGSPGFWLRLQINDVLAQVEQRADAIIVGSSPVPVQS